MKVINIYDKYRNMNYKYYSKNKDVPEQFSSDEYKIEISEEHILKCTFKDLINIPYSWLNYTGILAKEAFLTLGLLKYIEITILEPLDLMKEGYNMKLWWITVISYYFLASIVIGFIKSKSTDIIFQRLIFTFILVYCIFNSSDIKDSNWCIQLFFISIFLGIAKYLIKLLVWYYRYSKDGFIENC